MEPNSPGITVLGVIAAAVPGVLVALFAQYLTQRREDRQERRVGQNSRMLLALEIGSNLAALGQFWRTINELDGEKAEEAEAHLAGMAKAGLLGYNVPQWSAVHWERFSPRAVGALSGAEVEKVYGLYSDLRVLNELLTRLMTLTPEEVKEYATPGSTSRFWYNYFAGSRVALFERITAMVRRVQDAGNPLA